MTRFNCPSLLPPASKVWGKVKFSEVFVCPQGGITHPTVMLSCFTIDVVGGLLPPANVVCKGYVFTSACLSTGGVPALGDVWSWGCLLPGGGMPAPGGGACSQGGAWWRLPQTATAAGSTHPTGIHSCCSWFQDPLAGIWGRRPWGRQHTQFTKLY